ncbi:Zn 2cys6 transcription factor protein [Purpureocillium lavendulum]|uniref:Zn 2cys6 transcription factor protein n=1 Tax=Purpureocillium lavendulum TaxID=1247861 RepID=A0AB34FVJ8_9HYPO|nr:Zn 2cys6 transcription factor protein [Purpureocillium lavendulum]
MAHQSPGDDAELQRKRRRVRKGTQSCWECRRRKVRCSLTLPAGSTAAAAAACDACTRRGARCVGQELPDEGSPAQQVGDRLGRVEAMIEWLASRADYDHEREPDAVRVTTGSDGPRTRSQQPVAALSHNGLLDAAEVGQDDALHRQLVAAWPSQDEMEIIWSIPARVPSLQDTSCTPSRPEPGTSSPREALQLPPRGSHPVLIARKLLFLGYFLQGCSSQDLGDLGRARRDAIMACAMQTAHRLVTSNHDFVGSVDGVECLLIESLYHNHAGDLRRAWLAVRRAILMAQLMKLPRGANAKRVPVTDASDDIDHMFLWFRLAQMDRYLSLMLGLSAGSADDSFADPVLLGGCTPVERMQRIQCVAAGRILQRDQAETLDDEGMLSTTDEVDAMLRDAASLMPPEWWLPPSVDEGGLKTTARETARIMDLFTHHHLLTRLHLPFLLRPSIDGRYDYSKLTAVNASREAVSRFVSFRRSKSPVPYCRGVDFLAFIASATLCIAHIEAHRWSPNQAGSHKGRGTALGFLVHQRLADRAIMELTLDIMEFVARGDDGGGKKTDRIASSIAIILRRLLDIEADAAAGGAYSTNASHGGFSRPSSPVDGEEYYSDLAGSNGTTTLRIHIPHLGTIKIERVSARSAGADQAFFAVPSEVVGSDPRWPWTTSIDWQTDLDAPGPFESPLSAALVDAVPATTGDMSSVDISQGLPLGPRSDDAALLDVADRFFSSMGNINAANFARQPQGS